MLGSIGHHISRNLRLWTGLSLAIGVLAVLARNQFGAGSHFGDIASLAFMFAGMAIILISQQGMPQPVPVEEA